MIDRHFFEHLLDEEVGGKAQQAAGRAVVVTVHTKHGQALIAKQVVRVEDGYMVLAIYPNRGKPRVTSREERKQGAPDIDLDLIVIPYSAIISVAISTEMPTTGTGFVPSQARRD
ncbi:MAG TPA: hypothetical protein VGY48_35000 [Vicinamibacterales bacterium]|nr:hypothetical protein [Vicinamibacterales bacterium]